MRTALKAAVPALALMTALTACGEPTPTPGTSAPAATATTTTGPATETSKAADGGTGGLNGKAACVLEDLEVTIAAQGTGEKDEKGMVVVTNAGKKKCTVKGWLTITLYNAGDEPVDVPTEKVNEPGPAETVEIKAGGSAFLGIKWTRCDKADADCAVGNTIRWTPESSGKGSVAELEGFPAAEKSGITMKALKVGTFQPSNQGVTAW
jgi:predicted small lipoprotein YifL